MFSYQVKLKLGEKLKKKTIENYQYFAIFLLQTRSEYEQVIIFKNLKVAVAQLFKNKNLQLCSHNWDIKKEDN